MNLIDYIVLAGLAMVTICIVAWLIRRKKQGKSGCGCCPSHGFCPQKDSCDKFK